MKQKEIENHIAVLHEHLQSTVHVSPLDRALAAGALSELQEELAKAKKPPKQPKPPKK